MATTKEGTVIILDVGSSTNTTKGGKSFFENAKNCVDRILQRKIFSQPKDEVALLLMGTTATSNNLNSTLDGYAHISMAFDVEQANWKMLKVLEKEVTQNEAEADWLDAIIVAIDLLKSHSAKKFKTFKVVLLSPFLTPVHGVNLDVVISQMNSNQINLIVISDNIEYSLDPDDTDEQNETALFSQTIAKTQDQDRSQSLVTKIITETDGVLCSFDQALVQLIYIEKKKQRSMPWKADLEIGSDLKIKVSAYVHTRDSSSMAWKTGSMDYNCSLRTEYMHNDKLLDSDAFSSLIKGYMYGDTAVAFDASMRSQPTGGRNEKSLMCLGFSNQSLIRDEHCTGTGVWAVVAQPEYPVSERKFVHLVAAMKALNVALIARYIYRAGLKPKVMALFPVESRIPYRQAASLAMVELIYKENIYAMIVPTLRSKKSEATSEQLDAVDALIDAMNLMDSSDAAPNVEAFANNKILNPTTQHMYRVITHRALHPTRPIPMVDADLNERLDAPAKCKANAIAPLAALKTLFPLERVVIASKEQLFERIKKITSTSDEIESGAAQTVEPANVAADDYSLVEVGTMTPAEDFAELLRRGEKFSTLCAQMQTVIADLVLKTVSVQLLKVARAMMVYREEARQIGAFRYNEWIVEFKRVLVTRKRLDVWQDIVVKERFGLITAAEAESSTVNEAEANAFYELAGAGATRKPGDEDDEADEDVDDLIGNM